MTALCTALSAARRRREPAELEATRQLAFAAHGIADRAGYSEAANALLYVDEALAAMVSGEISTTPENWRQVEAAWRSAESATLAGAVTPATAPAERTQRVVVAEAGSKLSAILARRACDDRFEVLRLEELDESSAVGGADIVVLDWSAFGNTPCVHRAIAGARTIIAVAAEDAFESRQAAARAGARTYLTQREAPSQLRQAVRAAGMLSEPCKIAALVRPHLHPELRCVLGAHDVELDCTSDTSRLLEHLQSSRPDALVLDAGLELLDAATACRVLRSAPRWEDLPVTVLVDSPEQRPALFAAGADDVAMLSFADPVASRLRSLVARVDRARARASRDVLTGLLTRRALIERIEARMAEARRAKKYLSVCLLDVDHFKQVNDIHGHAAGDEVLAALGALFGSRFRQEDICGRWGGEEFTLAFFDEWSGSARQIVSRVAAELATTRFIGAAGQPFSVTLSGGVATFPVDGESLEELLHAADARLYAAKAAGRNRIVV